MSKTHLKYEKNMSAEFKNILTWIYLSKNCVMVKWFYKDYFNSIFYLWTLKTWILLLLFIIVCTFKLIHVHVYMDHYMVDFEFEKSMDCKEIICHIFSFASQLHCVFTCTCLCVYLHRNYFRCIHVQVSKYVNIEDIWTLRKYILCFWILNVNIKIKKCAMIANKTTKH